MLLYLGAFQFVPLASALGLVLLTALVSAAVSTVLGPRGADPAHTRPLTLLAALVAVAVAEGLARVVARVGRATRTATLLHLSKTGCVADEVGGKTAQLARLVALGVRVPPGFVVPAGALARQTPETLARAVTRWADARTVVVRSSFVGEDGARTFAGVFESVRGVPSADRDAVEAAIRRVLDSASAPRAAQYGHAATPALLVMHEVCGRHALIASRPWDGRADVVRVELDGAPPVDLDLALLGRPDSTVADCPDAPTLVRTALDVERAFGGPVQLEAVHDGARWWFVQARRIPVTPRRTYVADGAISLDPYARSEAVWARRGGLEGLVDGLRAALVAVGRRRDAAALDVGRFRLVDGRAYVDAELVRALATGRASGADVALQLAFALGRPSHESATADVPTLHAAQAREVMRLALLERLATAAAAHPPLPRSVVRLLARRREAARIARDALGTSLRAHEPEEAGAAGPSRIFDPPLASRPVGAPVPIVDRAFEGRVARVEALAPGTRPETPYVVVVPDGDPRHLGLALEATAVLLERGGTLSHLATVLVERDVPCLLTSPEHPLRHGARVRYDGRSLVEVVD